MLAVGAASTSLTLALTLLPATAATARVCFRAGQQPYYEIGQLLLATPLPSAAFPLLYAQPTPRDAVPAGVPFLLSVLGQGLSAPALLVKILPATAPCLGSADPMSNVVSGGGAQSLTSGLASFPGIADLGLVKVCIKGAGWPSFTEVPDSTFAVTSTFTTSVVFPTTVVQNIPTRITLAGTGLIPGRLGLKAEIRQDSCETGAVLTGGEEQALVDDDGGQGRKVYLQVSVSNPVAGASYLLCITENSNNSTQVAQLLVQALPSVVLHQTAAPRAVPFQVALSGVGLSPAAMLKFIRPTSVCSGLAGTTSQDAGIVSGGAAKPVVASSVAATATAAISQPATLAAAGTVKACFAPGAGASFTDLRTLGSSSNTALLVVGDYLPAMELELDAGSSSTGSATASARTVAVRGAPTSFVIFGAGVRAGDVVVLNRGPCPTDSSAPSMDIIAALDPVSGGLPRQLTPQNATRSACGVSGFRASFAAQETGAGFRLCYIPAGFALALQVPLAPDVVDVELPSLRSFSPQLTYANRLQRYSLVGSGGYRAGDKVKLAPAYLGSGFSPAATCGGVSDASAVPGGSAYVIRAQDISGTTVRVAFLVSQAWQVLRMCYLPQGAAAYQPVGSIQEMLQVRAPQIGAVLSVTIFARADADLAIIGNGLSTDDRFKIIPASGTCEGTDDAAGSVTGGAGRRPSAATDGGERVSVPFTLNTTAIGPAQVCFRHFFSCEYAAAGPITVAPPVLTALGSARLDGNLAEQVLVNRDSIVRVNGIGLSSNDIVRVVAAGSECDLTTASSTGRAFESFGESTLFQVNANRSSALVRLNLQSDKLEGKLCFRFCDAVGCSINSNQFVDTGISMPITQPAISAVSPSSIQVDIPTVVTITGLSLTPLDKVKIVEMGKKCAGFDDHLDILTGGNARRISLNQDCNQQPDGVMCTAVSTFSMTYGGYGKICFTSYGGSGFREASGSEGNVEVCTGICLSNITWPDIASAPRRGSSVWSVAVLASFSLAALIASESWTLMLRH